MKVDCQWFSTNLEAFFCESLDAQQLQMASEHLQTCVSCRSEVQSLRAVDPLVQQVLKFRMSKAIAATHAPKRSMTFQLGLAGAAIAVMGILAVVAYQGYNRGIDGILPPSQTALQNSASPDNGDAKVEATEPVHRAKTDAPETKTNGIRPGPEPAITDSSPAFLVTDPSGYSRSLEDYRGHVLLIGVWSADRPEAAQSIQRLYETFGSRKEVRILCVTSRGQERPSGMTCPLVFNNGSRLLETKNSDFAVVDKEGSVQLRGSLAGDSNALTTKIRAKLDELGGK